ncbi:large conductance mechanosensitive channel protein MscL [Mycoplasma sp. 5912]
MNKKDNKKSLLYESFTEASKFFKKGNLIILAVGFLAGTVFNAVVSSLANDVIMSAIAHNILGDKFKDIESLVWKGIKYGKFLGAIINFVIISFTLFIMLMSYFIIKAGIKRYRLKKNPPVAIEPEVVKPTTDELILEQLKLINQNLNKEPQNQQSDVDYQSE